MKTTFEKIIVRMPNWIGDIVMATPILTDLKAHFKHASLTVMVPSHLADVLAGHPSVDELFAFTVPNEFLRRITLRDITRRLKQGKYDLGILLPNSFSSAWWFFRGSVKTRIGFANDGRSFLLTKSLPIPKKSEQEHLVTTYKRLLTLFGMEISKTEPRLCVLDSEIEEARALIAQYKVPAGNRIIGINATAAYGSAKCWPPKRYRELIIRLIEDKKISVVCFGDHTTLPTLQSICEGLGSQVINLAGKTTIRQLMALIKQCALFITNDSGPMHIAAALDIPLLALFGSTNDTKTGPYNNGTIIHKRAACSPCYLRTCPIDFRCMKRISVDEVFAKALDELNR